MKFQTLLVTIVLIQLPSTVHSGAACVTDADFLCRKTGRGMQGKGFCMNNCDYHFPSSLTKSWGASDPYWFYKCPSGGICQEPPGGGALQCYPGSCTCPPGFDTIDRITCYGAIADMSFTFSEAKDYCQNQWGGQIAKAETSFMNTYFKYLINNADNPFRYKVYWTGLTEVNGRYVWYDTQNSAGYVDWDGIEYGKKDCVTFENCYGWTKDDCNYRYSVICQVPCQ